MRDSNQYNYTPDCVQIMFLIAEPLPKLFAVFSLKKCVKYFCISKLIALLEYLDCP